MTETRRTCTSKYIKIMSKCVDTGGFDFLDPFLRLLLADGGVKSHKEYVVEDI